MSENTLEVENFISRWSKSGASERANYTLFLSELCDLIGVPRPDPSVEKNQDNAYVIDRAITRTDKDGRNTTVYLDLYKRGHFVLETKQGSSGDAGAGSKLGHGKRGTTAWDKALDKAYNQAREYIRDIPAHEGRPPFLIVCDVGHVMDVYAEFSGTGGTYLRFPDPKNHRIFLEELHDPKKRKLLHDIWTDPHSLDPSKHAAKVTREVADTLAKLATSLEKDKHDPQIIATFLQRILFSLFAEDVGLLPEKSFQKLLETAAKSPQGFVTLITQLWSEMSTGTDFSTVLLQKVIHFNGGLFEKPTALPLATEQIQLLVHAAKQDWKEVEPAIFGTLLERALDPAERHKLGAHYTPRSYVERLIEPTLMQPLRSQWLAAKTAAALLHDKAEAAQPGSSDAKKLHHQAQQTVETFHRQLTATRVLDPACGSANFLYVALARIKELEAEVLDLLAELGGDLTLEMSTHMVRPDHFHGIEINPRAASIAQLVLWIGYFQWHHKTTGKADTNERPLLPKQQTIECRDAVLDYDQKIPRKDPETGEYLTIWDGRSTKTSPITGKEIPDESKRIPLYDYINPKRTTWPKADYIIGNPPFLGASRMRDSLGDGYTENLRKAWKNFKPDSWDFVMFWWHQAAETVRDGKAKAFGFITTNSISQTFNRRCIEPFLADEKKPISITFAIPDHPWIDAADCAAVRIAMTVGVKGHSTGMLHRVAREIETSNGEHEIEISKREGSIIPSLSIGANTTIAISLSQNENLVSEGIKPHGMGFVLNETEKLKLLATSTTGATVIKPYKNGRDIVQADRNVEIIDLLGYSEEEVKENFPSVYQYVYSEVKPERDQNNRATYRDNWWVFGEPRRNFRPVLKNVSRYIVTVKNGKHNIFIFLPKTTLPDSKLIAIGIEDPVYLSILSSLIHKNWAFAPGVGAFLGPTPTYVINNSFNKFPFPVFPDGELRTRLSDLGEKLDSFRKARQNEHPDLTLTGMYNVLEKIRTGEPLNDKEKTIHDQGLVSILKQIHDDIDAAVYQAYGWSDIWQWYQDANSGKCYDPETDIVERLELAPDTNIHEATADYREKYEQVLLQRLVDLNHQRAAEEAQGIIRYLRPDFQDPKGTRREVEQELNLPDAQKSVLVNLANKKLTWPKTLPLQVTELQPLITELGQDATILSQAFGRSSPKRQQEIQQILETLKALGQI